MPEEDYEILNSRSLATRGFETDYVFVGHDADQKDVDNMRKKAIVDALAQQILQRKTRLANLLGQELFRQAAILFLEELEASEPLIRRAERLNNSRARRRYMVFLEKLWDAFEQFLMNNVRGGTSGITSIAYRSPLPDPEEQRSWLRRMFSG